MSEYVRTIDGRLQTAVHHYLHPDLPRRVTIIGTHHFGVPAYWTDIRARIDRLVAGGAVVHCEGSMLVPDASDVTEDERRLLTELRRCRVLEQQRVSQVFGWVHQRDGLGYPPHWQVIDLSHLEILRRLGPDMIGKFIGPLRRMVDWPDDDRCGPARYRFLIAVRVRITGNDRAITRRGPADTVLVDDRQRLALDAVAGTGRDTVLVWGASHLAGLGTALRSRGFVRCGDTEWHTVLDLPPIWPAFRQLLPGGSTRSRKGRGAE
ncbi:hypothetical protein [Virgisporangium aurantiacum]|uniref:Uncharacterized protein n=1 Tax=Virgisporangium aurantiacum TaxID=175570 RepID=A0A8J3ZJF7_9ACTN|nr:hypothetical protein [Virgisporangium aurantiacum]GIJ63105.1 hypothetical protein Vau01_106210 [Virgisporangium aurantiacum]